MYQLLVVQSLELEEQNALLRENGQTSPLDSLAVAPEYVLSALENVSDNHPLLILAVHETSPRMTKSVSCHVTSI